MIENCDTGAFLQYRYSVLTAKNTCIICTPRYFDSNSVQAAVVELTMLTVTHTAGISAKIKPVDYVMSLTHVVTRSPR
jgi:hypothetical protein